jgi:hypothetical protein
MRIILACIGAIIAAWAGEAIGQDMLLGVGHSTGAAPAWTPASLTAPYSWYDPSDYSTMWQDAAKTTPVTAAGQSVCAINDKSGGGNHLTQSTTGNCPALTLDGSSRPYLACSGSKLLVGSTTSIVQNASFIFAGAAIQSSAGGMIWSAQTPAGGELIEVSYSNNGTGYELSGRRITGDSFSMVEVGSTDTTIQSYIAVHDYSGATTTLYKNGTAIVGPTSSQTAGLTANSTSPASSLCGWSGGGYTINANVYQVVVGQVLSTSDRGSLDTFLKSKVGL